MNNILDYLKCCHCNSKLTLTNQKYRRNDLYICSCKHMLLYCNTIVLQDINTFMFNYIDLKVYIFIDDNVNLDLGDLVTNYISKYKNKNISNINNIIKDINLFMQNIYFY
jgi:hypothetical protein